MITILAARRERVGSHNMLCTGTSTRTRTRTDRTRTMRSSVRRRNMHMQIINTTAQCFLILGIFSSVPILNVCQAFQPSSHSYPSSTSTLFRHGSTIKKFHTRETKKSNHLHNGLFSQRRVTATSRTSSKSKTALNMVFTTPSSIIEQASTKILLDDLIDESVRTSARYPVMMQFDPSSGWIWRRWKGTVFSETWRTFVRNMVYASIVCVIFKFYKTQFLQNLSGFNILWGQLLSVTTFTLTFFLNQSYSLWRNCYGFSRRLQGRLNDLSMTLAAHASREEPYTNQNDGTSADDGDGTNANTNTGSSTSKSTITGVSSGGKIPNSVPQPSVNFNATDFAYAADFTTATSFVSGEPFSTYTEPARQTLELMSRYIRVFNLLTYASFTGSHRPLLTPQGMRRLVDRGIITEDERQVLSEVQVPVTQRHNVMLLWIIRLFQDARRAGHIEGSDGFEQQFLEKCHVIRGQYGAIGDELAGRMPLAYAHIVQVLVDVILWMYPFMAFSTGMTPVLGVLGTGLLTMFYQGLFDLAKQFLDPYDNESYGKGEDPLCIDTLIAETNAGSIRWMNGLAEKPFAYEKIRKGDTLDYQLPLRGWTAEETDEREENALKLEQANREAEEAAQQLILLKQEESLSQTEILPLEVIEIDEGLEEIMMGDVDEEECEIQNEDNMTMEEALEQMEECTEKVP